MMIRDDFMKVRLLLRLKEKARVLANDILME